MIFLRFFILLLSALAVVFAFMNGINSEDAGTAFGYMVVATTFISVIAAVLHQWIREYKETTRRENFGRYHIEVEMSTGRTIYDPPEGFKPLEPFTPLEIDLPEQRKLRE